MKEKKETSWWLRHLMETQAPTIIPFPREQQEAGPAILIMEIGQM
jgi:hypothetical protein